MVSTFRFQTIYDVSDVVKEKTTVFNNEPSMCQQQFKEDADINVIISRYRTTRLLTDPMHPATTPPQFGDFSAVPDLMEVQEQLIEAENAFMALPAELRRRFDNDPLSLLEFIQNEENRAEAIELGLLEKPVVAEVETKTLESAQNAT